MNIGFVSSWDEQGSAYVTRQYINLLKEEHHVFVYARTNEHSEPDRNWNQDYVTWAYKTLGTMHIFWPQFYRWVRKNRLDVVFFNEQQDMEILAQIKKYMPDLKIGAYIDYYKQNTVDKHRLYDFLICNTKRHYSVFQWHKQCYYVPWGTDTDLYVPKEPKADRKKLVFFHSAGNYPERKGTLSVLDVFLKTDLWKQSRLVIHIQNNSLQKYGYDYEELKRKHVRIIQRTVTPPGLYYLGDVYVYPAILDGLGLTLYEAVSCGLPVIGTDTGPINEVIKDGVNGKLVEVEKSIAREDGYYWPLSFVNEKSLYRAMRYYVDHAAEMKTVRKSVREHAVQAYTWKDRGEAIRRIFSDTKVLHEYDRKYLAHYNEKRLIGEKLDQCIYFVYLNLRAMLHI